MKARMINPIEILETLTNAEREVYQYLMDKELGFCAYHHEETPTAEDVAHLEESIRGRHCKNLLLINSKGDQLYMLIAPHDLQVNLRSVARQINSTRLSFADSELMQALLKLEPGSVSPFGLMNDQEHRIKLLLDERLLSYDFINFHPNVNTATLSLSFSDFQAFIGSLSRSLATVDSARVVD